MFLGIVSRTKKCVFRLARRIPAINRKIDTEMEKLRIGFEEDVQKATNGLDYYTVLPEDSLRPEQILQVVDKYLSLGHYQWQDGRVSGTVYNYDEELVKLVTDVYGKTSYTNPLHSDVFPGICKMEAEVVRMTANLFNGSADSCGTVIVLL